MNLNILIAGGTGLIGKHFMEKLLKNNHHLFVLTRNPKKYETKDRITYFNYHLDVKKLPPIDAVINLAGESLFGYWTNLKKKRIMKSRLKVTHQLTDLMKQMSPKPKVFLSASAIGYYGVSKERIFTENTQQAGEDFLAQVATTWEDAASRAEQEGIRTVYTRFGVVLGKEGALPLMRLPISLYLGGKIGKGDQYMSWVHIHDVTEMLLHCLNNPKIRGPVNMTAPKPVQNKYFTKKLAQLLKRPYFLTVPRPILQGVLRDMSILIADGQYVLPKKMTDHGYTFQYPTIEKALKHLLFD